ncbi:hypothetical protein SAMN05421664_1484 [Chryseobacterium soldanellicola]|uniref:Colicin import membrane protein n=1 Tax=Chryseobacterium soldanellicola TaxID=311333 RepID=A0A1H1ALV5_9FLAO|nr:hypothetical protein [Chryseobacterium soldanellicola]SDQ40642.1 hypothetical protein SAMN05421664_1484 [Chryseobacterium soldanellicola]
MKSLYIIAFLSLSIGIYAQENKKATEPEDQSQVVKQAKEREAQMLKTSQENASKKQAGSGLVSDQGLEVKNKETKPQPSASTANSGKQLPGTATLEEIKASIPNRKAPNHTSAKKSKTVQGLPNTATLAEIKKTIPKN